MSWSDDEDIDEDEEQEVDVEEEEEDFEDEDDDDEEVVLNPGRTSYSVYRRKYSLLLERCEAIQQDNERLVSRVREVRRLWRRGMKERKFLMDRLDSHGDNYRNVPINWPPEDDPANTSKKAGKEKKMKKGSSIVDSPNNSVNDSPSNGLDKVGKSGKGRKSKGEKEKKQPRDPNLPKRPQNPFFQFCREQREVVSKDILDNQSVNLTKKELTKVLASRWNQLNPDEKQIYNQKFEEEKVGYNQKMEVYRRLKMETDNSVLLDSDLRVGNFDIDDSFD